MKVKICGLKRKEDIIYVNQYKPDWIGFVFAGTKRKIDFETAKDLKRELSKEIKAVGVFVNEEIPYISKLVGAQVIDMIQLHGDEEKEYIDALRSRLDKDGNGKIPIIKAVRVRSTKQVLESEKLPVEYLLLDAFSKEEYGGSGVVFDHKLIPDLKKPYILAGGIGLENVDGILEELKKQNNLPICVDVSSSVETNGYKDKMKIEEIIQKIRNE